MIGALGATLVLGVLAAVARGSRLATAVDIGVLCVAVLELAARARVALVAGRISVVTDVGMVLQSAAQGLLDGQHLYGVGHPDASGDTPPGTRSGPRSPRTAAS